MLIWAGEIRSAASLAAELSSRRRTKKVSSISSRAGEITQVPLLGM
jgi:hypothetical protein